LKADFDGLKQWQIEFKKRPLVSAQQEAQ
jgi:hypothetical protein